MYSLFILVLYIEYVFYYILCFIFIYVKNLKNKKVLCIFYFKIKNFNRFFKICFYLNLI